MVFKWGSTGDFITSTSWGIFEKHNTSRQAGMAVHIAHKATTVDECKRNDSPRKDRSTSVTSYPSHVTPAHAHSGTLSFQPDSCAASHVSVDTTERRAMRTLAELGGGIGGGGRGGGAGGGEGGPEHGAFRPVLEMITVVEPLANRPWRRPHSAVL